MSKPMDGGRRPAPPTGRRARPARAGVPAGSPPDARSTVAAEDRLARLLETPHFARMVPRLPPETLQQLIRHRGLEACGELLRAATPEQLSSVLDIDLWRRAEPAGDERLDPDRFGEWLETLAYSGTPAAGIVSRIDERLVTAGLSSHIRVFDPAARAPPDSSDGGAMDDDGAPFTDLSSEVGGYLVLARRSDAWDAILALLLSLEAEHREYFDTVMRGCRRLSNSTPEADGFHDLLTEPEQLLHDLGLARDARRTRQGYLTPADARLVLQVARQASLDAWERCPAIELIAADHLRGDDWVEPGGAGGPGTPPRQGAAAIPTEAQIGDSIEAVVELLAEAGLAREPPRALLEAGPGRPSGSERLRALLAHLHAADAAAYAARNRELAFLANALMAGCSIQARPFTAHEASDAVLAVCNLGLEEWQAGPPEGETRETAATVRRRGLPDSYLAGHDLLKAFQLGWRTLHDMSMAAARRLAEVLEDLRSVDVETREGLDALRRELIKQRVAGTPWRARDALDVIAVLDLPAWVSLLGVLDECPVLPAALTATLEGRTGAVSATAFEFISTRSQLEEVRAFMAKVRDILLRP